MIEGVLSREVVDRLGLALRTVASQESAHGVRNLMNKVPEIRELACSAALTDLAAALRGHPMLPVRAIFFDKPSEANWYVTWHQDLGIAVKGRAELPGFGPWSVKEGVVHVQPPEALLRGMVTLRVHLDPADERNGALRVIPGSHKRGRLALRDIPEAVKNAVARSCNAGLGDVLAMSPLILHASSKATVPGHRRVIHIEYARDSLPPPLSWAEA